MWIAIISILLLILPVLFVWQYLRLSRRYYFDQSLYALRSLKQETILSLSEQLMGKQYDKEEIIELRKMAAVLDFSIEKFELLKAKIFNYKSFKRIFLSIDFSVKKAEKEVHMQSQRLISLKIKFSRALLLAFCTEFFFRHKFALFILRFTFKVLARISMRYTENSIKKLTHIVSTYKQVERNSHNGDTIVC